jgi:ribonuclease HI
MTILQQFGIDKNFIYESKMKHSNIVNDNIVDIIPTSFCVFIDGSAINNGKHNCIASYAAVFPNYPQLNISGILDNSNHVSTNNRAEYMACIKAIEQANIQDPKCELMLIIYSDSKLLIDSMSKWIYNWKRNSWKKSDGQPVLNRDLLETIEKLLENRKVVWEHVKAHTGRKDFKSIWNDKADIIAKDTINNRKNKSIFL